jgi:hypothetical protein
MTSSFPFQKNPDPQEQVIIEGKVWEWHETAPGQGHWDISNVLPSTDLAFAAGVVLDLNTSQDVEEGGGVNPPGVTTNVTYSFDMSDIEENV